MPVVQDEAAKAHQLSKSKAESDPAEQVPPSEPEEQPKVQHDILKLR